MTDRAADHTTADRTTARLRSEGAYARDSRGTKQRGVIKRASAKAARKAARLSLRD